MFDRIGRAWRALHLGVRAGVVAGAILVIGALWTFTPALYDRRVDEAFPATGAAASPLPAPTAAVAPASTASPLPAPTASVAPTPTATVAPASTASPLPAPTAAVVPTPTASPLPAPTATLPPAEPIALARGVFIKGSIRGDEAEGSATIYRLADGSLVLRLESFSTTNGPDLVVAAHPAANPEQQAGPYLVLAGLKGNQGNQNYELPADFDPGAYGSIVIWCRTFDVVFGYAALTPL